LRKTSRYASRRRRVDPLGGLRLIAETKLFDEVELRTLSLPPRAAYDAIRVGRAREGDFDTLAAVVNVSLIRCESIGQEGVDLCTDAQEALLRIKERHQRTGRWGVDHIAIQAIPPVLDLHEQLLALSTPKQMMDAMKEVLRRMNAGETVELV
jgi:hypothetical protein